MKNLTFIFYIPIITLISTSISFGQVGNTIYGHKAGDNLSSGDYNSFFGEHSGSVNSTGSQNTFIGQGAGGTITSGKWNTYVGQAAGGSGAGNSEKNTMVGSGAGYGSTGSYNVFLGNEAGAWTGESNRLIIENSYYNPLIYGNFDSKQVGIGTSNLGNHALSVCGSIRAVGELLLESNNGWCDYVFLSDYKLPSIQEEAQHIQEKGHLIGFQSEAEMDGTIIVGDITKRQQAKIEEMMLHLIKMDEEMTKMKEEMKRLNVENEELKTKMSKQP